MLGERHKSKKNIISVVLAILVIPALMLSNVAISVSENLADHDRLLPDPPTAQNKSQMSNGTLSALGVQAEVLKLPLSFIENKGQVSDDAKFMVKMSHETVYFEPSEVQFVLNSKNNTSIVRMSFEGARASQLLGENRLSGIANFFIGNNSSKWVTDIPTYSSVKYESLYPGVDLVFKGTEGNLKHEFVLKPGADPDKIILAFNGQDSLSIDKNGSIQIKTGTENLTDSAPLCYQDINGIRVDVKGVYRRIDDKRIGFGIHDYNRSLPLVIDPFLRYSTYLGGSGNDIGWGIAVDGSGNAYVTGETASTNFPTTPGANQTYGGNTDAFVAKLNPSGSGLIYSTYLGGSVGDVGRNIAVDSSGNAYVTGYTNSADFPTTPGANQTTYGGNTDAFVAKLDSSGSGLVYSTYLGGSQYDVGTIMAVDGSRNVHVIGGTDSSDFPITPGAYQTTNNADGADSAFIAKLNPSGSDLAYSTYLGGTHYAFGRGIAVDSSGNAYVTGSTSATDFPTTPGAYQTAYGGGAYNAFITKLNPTGSGLVYSTYLGGSDGTDYGKSIAVDSSGNAYVTGAASSTDFPTTPGAFQTTYIAGGAGGSFVTKLNPSGSGLAYSTYLSGHGYAEGNGIAIDSSGDAYATGVTSSTDFPTTSDAYQTAYGGGTSNAFVTKLNPSGSGLVYSTYLGGSNGADYGKSITVDSGRNIYVAGGASSTNFPTTPGAYQAANAGNSDAFIAMIALNAPPKDMIVTKIACTGSTKNISEVEAGSQFYYNISVINPTGHDAVDVVVTDKLPYNVDYLGAVATDANGNILHNVTISETGDLLYVRYLGVIPAYKTYFINVSVRAPTEAPDTLYNILNIRYANDPNPDNNTFTLVTYVPVTGYNKSLAVESFEELLHNQTRLLFDFEDLLHTTPRNGSENYTFITSFEQLLRAQANLSLSFEDLLENQSATGWDDANLPPGFQEQFLKSFNRIIWDQAFLFASFEMKLKDAWISLDSVNGTGTPWSGKRWNHTQDAQTEFIASFESLLKEQVKLFDSYQLLMKTINTTDIDVKVDGLAAFENLLRVQTNLLMSFEDLLDAKYKDMEFPWNPQAAPPSSS
jgi:uncharacterized repeat protein (TIGR01451 family)